MSDAQNEVYRAYVAAQDRYAYFIMAAAGASVAFAVARTEATAWSESTFLWCAAVAMWGISFVCGLHHMRWVRAGLWQNLSLLQVRAGKDPMLGRDRELIEKASGIIDKSHKAGSSKSAWFAQAQLWLFLVGAVFYILWHVYEMVRRAENTLLLPYDCVDLGTAAWLGVCLN